MAARVGSGPSRGLGSHHHRQPPGDAAARRLSWDSPRLSGYRGTLQVAGHTEGSHVTVQVTIPDVLARADEEINRGLRETLDRIARLAAE